VLPGYEMVRLIGRGGMGAVYEARQSSSSAVRAAARSPPAATAAATTDQRVTGKDDDSLSFIAAGEGTGKQNPGKAGGFKKLRPILLHTAASGEEPCELPNPKP